MLKTGLRNETTKKLNKIINHMRERASRAGISGGFLVFVVGLWLKLRVN